MKTSHFLILSAISITILACSDNEKADIQPQTALEKTSTYDKNLRPATGEKPDLKVHPFFVSGLVTLDLGNYKIPVSFKELNTGNANDTGAFADSLKVYQKLPTALIGIYTYRHLGTFLRPVNIPMGASWYLNSIVNFPAKWRPISRKTNLVIKADDGNTIYESDESNNDSETIWNIYLI